MIVPSLPELLLHVFIGVGTLQTNSKEWLNSHEFTKAKGQICHDDHESTGPSQLVGRQSARFCERYSLHIDMTIYKLSSFSCLHTSWPQVFIIISLPEESGCYRSSSSMLIVRPEPQNLVKSLANVCSNVVGRKHWAVSAALCRVVASTPAAKLALQQDSLGLVKRVLAAAPLQAAICW